MSAKQLAARRVELIERIAQQREDIALLTHAIERPLQFVDKGYALIKKVKQHSALTLAGTFLFVAVFRRSLLSRGRTILTIAEWLLFKKK